MLASKHDTLTVALLSSDVVDVIESMVDLGKDHISKRHRAIAPRVSREQLVNRDVI